MQNPVVIYRTVCFANYLKHHGVGLLNKCSKICLILNLKISDMCLMMLSCMYVLCQQAYFI